MIYVVQNKYIQPYFKQVKHLCLEQLALFNNVCISYPEEPLEEFGLFNIVRIVL